MQSAAPYLLMYLLVNSSELANYVAILVEVIFVIVAITRYTTDSRLLTEYHKELRHLNVVCS